MNLFNEIAGSITTSLNINFDHTRFTNPASNRTSSISAGSGTADQASAIAKEVETRSAGLSFSETLEAFMQHNDLDSEIAIAIASASARYEMDPNLIRAVIRAESSYNPNAVSSAGAMGLMQLMPRTAESLGVTDPFNISQNVHGGT
ncbi:MAG: lytic transglycosylase domain-containing protein, partial [Defluviitaleaceae bacterium]|nr:lytic transglycosylase domain-containing protein [Defluviitaleaceae bacterium]